MDAQAMRDATALFDDLQDPRVVGRCKHRLTDIVMIALVALIGPCEEWDDVEEFAKAYEDWFKRFLELPHAIPSHDTFGRVFGMLDPAQMNACFEAWLTFLVTQLGDDAASDKTIAIDGKALRASNAAKGAAGQPPLHLASAWAHESGLVLGQVKCDDKSNEITALPELLDMLDLEGKLVTIDAPPGVGCQKQIARKLHENKADYALTLKDNHRTLCTQAALLMAESDGEDGPVKGKTHRTDDRGHGRD